MHALKPCWSQRSCLDMHSSASAIFTKQFGPFMCRHRTNPLNPPQQPSNLSWKYLEVWKVQSSCPRKLTVEPYAGSSADVPARPHSHPRGGRGPRPGRPLCSQGHLAACENVFFLGTIDYTSSIHKYLYYPLVSILLSLPQIVSLCDAWLRS